VIDATTPLPGGPGLATAGPELVVLAVLTGALDLDQDSAEGKAKGLAEGKANGLAEGEAKGEARMVLRVLAARGLEVPEEMRQQVLSCADMALLETWGDRASTAASVEDVFGS